MFGKIAHSNRRKSRERYSALGCFVLLVMAGGCAGQSDSDEQRLSHILPSHWPENLADAGLKLEQRLKLLRGDEQATKERRELLEIVSWLPEIAADTELKETQWQPLYDQSESLRVKLAENRSINELDDEFQQLLKLIQRLETQASP